MHAMRCGWRESITVLLLALACGSAGALDLQAHRGGTGLAPENTLASFARALSLGVTTLELDIAITKDDVLVIHHDPTLNPATTRGPDGRFLDAKGAPIRQLSFDELQRFDVGRLNPGLPYARRHPQQQPSDGARIPRLADLFALVRKAGNTDVRFAIETKVTPFDGDSVVAPEPFARALIAAIREAGMASRSTVLSFDWRTLAVVQREASEIGTVYLSAQQQWGDNIGAGKPEPSPWTAGVHLKDHGSVPRMVRTAGGRVWSTYFAELDAVRVAEARAAGLTVLAWTANELRDIERMLDLGVDGIVSDRPDRVREAMARRGLPLPPATPVQP